MNNSTKAALVGALVILILYGAIRLIFHKSEPAAVPAVAEAPVVQQVEPAANAAVEDFASDTDEKAVPERATAEDVFVGRWVSNDGSEDLELGKNGTGTFYSRENAEIEWEVTNLQEAKMLIIRQGQAELCISEETLRLTDTGSPPVSLRRRDGGKVGGVLVDYCP